MKLTKWDIGELIFGVLGMLGTVFGIAYGQHQANQMQDYRELVREEVKNQLEERN